MSSVDADFVGIFVATSLDQAAERAEASERKRGQRGKPGKPDQSDKLDLERSTSRSPRGPGDRNQSC
jgi:hypothetical protein